VDGGIDYEEHTATIGIWSLEDASGSGKCRAGVQRPCWCSAVLATQPAQAQVFTVLASFDGTNGVSPAAGLVQATNGNLYGTADGGGVNSEGNVFEVTTSGTLTSIYSFCSPQNDSVHRRR
jgi:uncharacterized repeat protein (TIGR03803 family)